MTLVNPVSLITDAVFEDDALENIMFFRPHLIHSVNESAGSYTVSISRSKFQNAEKNTHCNEVTILGSHMHIRPFELT